MHQGKEQMELIVPLIHWRVNHLHVDVDSLLLDIAHGQTEADTTKVKMTYREISWDFLIQAPDSDLKHKLHHRDWHLEHLDPYRIHRGQLKMGFRPVEPPHLVHKKEEWRAKVSHEFCGDG